MQFYVLLLRCFKVRKLIKGNTDTYFFCTTIITHFYNLFLSYINYFKNFYNCFYKHRWNLGIFKS